MSVILPEYEDSRLVAFSACGVIDSDMPQQEEIHLEARDDSAADPVLVRMFVNPQDDPVGTHFHIATARESWFDSVPATNDPLSAVLNQIDRYAGSDIYVNSKARFRVPLRREAGGNIMAAMLAATPRDGSGPRLTGISFDFDDALFDRISWTLRKDDNGEFLVVTVYNGAKHVVSRQYLSECLGPLRLALEVFGVSNERRD